MRLWTLHPKYLDARGLVAAWREALLAQAVLAGATRGYTAHPQLLRFRRAAAPMAAIAAYLDELHKEATCRGYAFDRRKIRRAAKARRIRATRGQLRYEWRHLQAKLQKRDPAWLARLGRVVRPGAHPLFRIVPGTVEAWEVVRGAERGIRPRPSR